LDVFIITGNFSQGGYASAWVCHQCTRHEGKRQVVYPTQLLSYHGEEFAPWKYALTRFPMKMSLSTIDGIPKMSLSTIDGIPQNIPK
jgi:hypothetical protein